MNYLEFSKKVFDSYETWRNGNFSFHIFPNELEKKINSLNKEKVKIEIAGTSFENRNIYHIKIGSGKIKILLWSQMHGDESTATKSILDVLNFLSTDETIQTKKILENLSLYFVPMLNPDGAEKIKRRNAQNIDINRDAISSQTYEGKILNGLKLELKPNFAFNLHDQEISTVGTTNEITVIALLSPAFDKTKSDSETRIKSKKICAILTEIASQFIPKNVAKYNDDFEPRAFGDTFQSSNIATILVEGGHIKNDFNKQTVQKIYSVILLSSIYSIASNEFENIDINYYETLPFNTKKVYDIILRNTIIKMQNETFTTDIAVSYQVDTHFEFPPKIVDIGDLSTYTSLLEFNLNKVIPIEKIKLNETLDLEFFSSLLEMNLKKLPL